MMLNFLNLFEKREEKKILDPFVGYGTIALFAHLQGFQVYGSDIDPQKVESTIRNLKWLINDLKEPSPLLLDARFKKSEINALSKNFEDNLFDGICTEPFLGPFYTKKPYYIDGIELIEEQLDPQFEAFFREAYKILKPRCRICITTPIISTLDGGDVQIDIKKHAMEHNFKTIPMINKKRIVNKSNIKLQFRKQHIRNIIDAKKGQIFKRKIHVFEKKSKEQKNEFQ